MENTKSVKVYPSSIAPVTKGDIIEPVRNSMTASSFQIEVVHVGCFLLLLVFVFAGAWIQATSKEKKEVLQGQEA